MIPVVSKSRVPPGQRVTRRWPRLDLGIVPGFDPATWDFRVDGVVENEIRLTWDALQRLPAVRVTADMHCVTGWTTLDNVWEGVGFRTVAEQAKPRASARFARLTCGDAGYTTNLPLEVLMDEDVLFAYRHDGRPLPPEHGGPLRLVVPKRYAWKSAKWVRRVTFLDRDDPGYWEVRGYSNTADPWTEDRYSF